MKKSIIMALAALALAACEPLGGGEKPSYSNSNANQWVYDVMKENYLWASSLPSTYATSGGASTPTQEYFDDNLRYRSNRSVPYENDTYGDRFSSIAKVAPTTRSMAAQMRNDYGFFPVYTPGPTDDLSFFQVLFVQPGSPADGKLKRGDAFQRINGQLATWENFSQLLMSPTLEVEVLETDPSPHIRRVNLTPESYYEQPILIDTVYEGKNTAYMLYNSFAMGDQSGPAAYAQQMRDAFGRFAAAGVRNLILDLRYNGGGEVNAAQLLASLIVPRSELGSTFMYARNNKDEYIPMNLLSPSDVTQNAAIENLIILTSANTASSSELIIHNLKPIYGNRLRILGQTTVGKNVGSITITHTKLGWQMTPMIFMAYDRNKVSGYERGIEPDMRIREYGRLPGSDSPFFYLGALGDYEDERMLNAAMHELFPEVPIVNIDAASGAGTRSGETLNPIARIPQRGMSFGHVFAE